MEGHEETAGVLGWLQAWWPLGAAVLSGVCVGVGAAWSFLRTHFVPRTEMQNILQEQQKTFRTMLQDEFARHEGREGKRMERIEDRVSEMATNLGTITGRVESWDGHERRR